MGNNLVARYQQRLFDHLMRLDLSFFNEQRSAHLAAQISQNVMGIRDLLNIVITTLARDVMSLVALVAVMVWQDWALSLIALLIAPLLVYSVSRLMDRVRELTHQSVEVNSRLFGTLQEAVQGITIVKAFTLENELSAKAAGLMALAEAQANRMVRLTERVSPIAETLAGLAVGGVSAYAGYRALHGNQPPGTVFSFVTALMLAYDPARRLARVQVGLQGSLANARMIYALLDMRPRQDNATDARPLLVGQAELRFEGVCFSYRKGLPVLHDVSFTAAPGKVTAMSGAGAGKTTWPRCCRGFSPDSGRIAIDRQDISAVTKASLRRSIAYVSQQPYLFEGTIRDNIRYGRPDATDAEVEKAARIAQADDFIARQPRGYNSPVAENGVTLSGGQRQRLAIARAIVRNAPLLVLDEATSAIDNKSEARVQAALAEVMKGRTTIVIAHRLSTVVNADNIVVLAHGEVVEQGTHRQLVSRSGGAYARLYGVQGSKGLGLANDLHDVQAGRRLERVLPL